MKLGFIGIGNISSDVIEGISNSRIKFKKLFYLLEIKINQKILKEILKK